jgi:hypothetical protein
VSLIIETAPLSLCAGKRPKSRKFWKRVSSELHDAPLHYASYYQVRRLLRPNALTTYEPEISSCDSVWWEDEACILRLGGG